MLAIHHNVTAEAPEDGGQSVVVEEAMGRWEQQADIEGFVNGVELIIFQADLQGELKRAWWFGQTVRWIL